MKYLIRLDDACPTMDGRKWNQIEQIFDNLGIKPMVGIIPANADSMQQIDAPNPNFWAKVKKWESKGWAIALHGYDHCYKSTKSGINPLWNRSEFAGIPLEEQKEKIRKGIEIFRSHRINPKYFFAPSHTFDLNTLKALKACSDIRIISDTVARKPYKRYGFTFIPQLGGMPRNMPFDGVWTFCLHPSMMTYEDIKKVEKFINENKAKFIPFDKLDISELQPKDIISQLLSFAYFTIRKIRNIK